MANRSLTSDWKIHERNRAKLDRLLLELDQIAQSITHSESSEFCQQALINIRNAMTIESALCFDSDEKITLAEKSSDDRTDY